MVADVNIFLLEDGPDGRPDPEASARSLCDPHLYSQIKETAQLLCNAALANGVDDAPYREGFPNHPVSKWVSRGDATWEFTVRLGRALMYEYMRAFNKVHRSMPVIVWASQLDASGFRPGRRDPWCLAIPKDLRDQDEPVESYRAYYRRKEFSWACKQRRGWAAAQALSWAPHGGRLFPFSEMRWSGPGRSRPAWMPEEPLCVTLTDAERELCRSLPQPTSAIMGAGSGRSQLGAYIKEHGAQIDDLLGIPPEEARTRGVFDAAAAEFGGSMSSKAWRKRQ